MMCKKLIPLVLASFTLGVINGAYAQCFIGPGETLTVSGTDSLVCDRLEVQGTLIVENGGQVTYNSTSEVHQNGQIIVNDGGTITGDARFDMDAGGTIVMNGGLWSHYYTFKVPDNGGPVYITMNGGTLWVNDMETFCERNALITIGAGILRVDDTRDVRRDPQEWLDNGCLVPAAGFAEIIITPFGVYGAEVSTTPAAPTVQFESAASGDFESITPALITVGLTYPVEGETYTVDYAATGGTATGGGVDYTLEPGTLIFNPGDTSKTISIDIVNDGGQEEDETIIVTLSNPTGLDVVLGIAEHTYMIEAIVSGPSVTLVSPEDYSIVDTTSVEFTCSATDQVELKDATLYVGSSSETLTFSGPDETDDAQLYATDDSSTGEVEGPGTNAGTAANINVDGDNPHAHAVIKFPNVFGGGAGQVLPGSSVISATLKVNCSNLGNMMKLYRLTEDWVEGEVTWNERQSGMSWTNLGADGSGSNAGVALDGDCTATGWRTIDITQFAQEWSDGAANYGILMADTGTDGIDFDSSESANPPVLTVTYLTAWEPKQTQSMSGTSDTVTFDPITLADQQDHIWNCLVTNTLDEENWAPADLHLTVDTSYVPPVPVILKGPYLQQLTADSIVIMWETDIAAGSRVDYGPAAPDEYYVEDSTPVVIHEMQLTELTADTVYYYTVTSGGVTSATSMFATAPATERSFRFVAYGDSRTQPSEHAAVVQAIINSAPEVVLHTGDLVATGGYEAEWGPQFFDPAHDLMINTALLPILGNHEYKESGQLLFLDFFSLPNNEEWFAFTYGGVRFIALNTNVNYSSGSGQYNWLVTELQSAEYNNATWNIVYFHHPPYTATENHSDDTNVQAYLVPLFEEYGVDMVFNGHSHAYERYLHNDIYYIVTGGGGAPLRNVINDNKDPIRQYGEKVYHHCVIDVDVPGQSLTLSARYNNGQEFDTITITKTSKATNPDPPDGATQVALDADLSWTAGVDAVSHDVYFGTNPTPGAAEFQGNQPEATYDPALELDTTYYWAIDERDSYDVITYGDVWSFTTESIPPELPWSDGFESGNFTAGGWTTSGDCKVVNRSPYAGSYTAKIKKVAWIEKTISTTGFTNIHVKYARYTKGFDADEFLVVEWYDGSSWYELESTQNTSWATQDMTLPSDADNNSGFRVRFRTNTNREEAYLDDVEITGLAAGPDNTAPNPNPMTWATAPYSTGETSIAMVATTASDSSGVDYYFACTDGGGHDSGWQDSTSYVDTGLSSGTQYTYTVTACDKSVAQNQTAASSPASATTDAPDTAPPSPDPMTWATVPYATGSTSIAMVAATASDPSGVEYDFTCTAGGGNDSGWQDNPSYEDTGLTADTQYTYTVTARDKSVAQNSTGTSTAASATTDAEAGDVVTITKAEFNIGKSELKVEATSSDGGTAVLTVVGYGTMTYDTRKNKYVFREKPKADPGGTVTVTSSLGGSDTAPVTHK